MNQKAVKAMADFLQAMGIDVTKNGMEKTPERVAAMYEFLFNGMGRSTSQVWGETFTAPTEGIVAVRHIPFYSMCEHHLLPFFGEVSIAYLPHEGRIAGFSKFASLVEIISHRPQLQERMTCQLAESVRKDLGADGVLVIVDAQQLCMCMRGEMAHGTHTVTSECNGILAEENALAQQAWLMIGGKNE